MTPIFLDDLFIEKYRFGLFHVYTSCIFWIQVNTIVNVWRDSEGEFNCQEADTEMGGFSGNDAPNKVSEQIVNSKDFQECVIDKIRHDYDLSQNVEDYFEKYEDYDEQLLHLVGYTPIYLR